MRCMYDCLSQRALLAYKFTGKERDSESGLDMFGARYYGSSLGRFMTPDWADKPTDVPYADFGDPQSLNLYGYVRNNPLSHADADGHCCDDEIDFGVGVLRGIASSVSFGYFGAPKSTDSGASIAGQLTGTGIVGATGEITKDAGTGTAAVGLVAEAPLSELQRQSWVQEGWESLLAQRWKPGLLPTWRGSSRPRSRWLEGPRPTRLPASLPAVKPRMSTETNWDQAATSRSTPRAAIRVKPRGTGR